MTADVLVIDRLVDGEVSVAVEFDAPALRAIVSYPGFADREGRTLYWNLGGDLPTYSFGMDVHATSRRIALVDLRLYGGHLEAVPASDDSPASSTGIPLVDVAPWGPESPFLDINEGFVLQSHGQGLRIELDRQPIQRCVVLDGRLTLELDAHKRLCAIRVGQLPAHIMRFMAHRYGSCSDIASGYPRDRSPRRR